MIATLLLANTKFLDVVRLTTGRHFTWKAKLALEYGKTCRELISNEAVLNDRYI